MSAPTLSPAARARLLECMRREAGRPIQPKVATLVAALRERFGEQFAGALYYGSCRRQAEPEGVIDLHVLLHDPRPVLGAVSAGLCRLLPPNVYYLEVTHGDAVVRCKYAVLSVAQFHRSCTRAAFHSYFWARYAQPLTLVELDDHEAGLNSLVTALQTLAGRALPLIDEGADWHEFWVRTLGLCYRAELRAEGSGRAEFLVAGHAEHYRELGTTVLDDLPRGRRWPAKLAWTLRIVLGKPLSLARLIKGLYTFDGGLDYVAWKLERHTGKPVEIPERVRRRPLIFLWPLIYKLWREGMFR
ncbi:MAG: hypothetical protein JJT88_08405 [Gammaproteobacteria bacterium]|nr:hypothetical protein [Gammaproteobacteria bacterium]